MNILALICLILAAGTFAYFIFKMSKILKNHIIGQTKYKIEGKERRNFLLLVGGTGLLLSLSAVFYCIYNKFGMNFFEYLIAILGALFFGVGLSYAIGGFMLYYYKLDLDDEQKKVCRITWPLGFVVVILGLYLYTTGIADYISYPLASGFSFSDGWIRGGDVGNGFKVKFYGILIVSGALLCYLITDHMTYKKFKKHGLIDTLFIVAFLFGILGARLWYCLVLEPEFFLKYPGQIFIGIASGGLAVQGGAILGIIAGVTFMLLFRKYIDVRFMMDVAIPTILLAQAIGRLGNFFNQEVYGAATQMSTLWFLPKIMKYNMFIEGNYRIPLFFIEATMNVSGYFFIRYFLGKVCKFHIGLGYQASSYIAWYGMTRAVLELFRDPEFRYMQSWYIAFGMLAAGLLLMLGFYALHKIRMSKNKEDTFGEKI